MGLRGKQVDTRFDPAYDDWELPPFTSLAQHVIDTVVSLPCPSGHGLGAPFQLLSYQTTIIRRVYATDRRGNRKIKEALVSVPRGNGKTGLVVMLLLYELLTRKAGELYAAAASREQAARTHQEMARVIVQVKPLYDLITIGSYKKELHNRKTGTIFKALASDAGTVLGLAPSMACVDEVAAHKNSNLFDAIKTAMGKSPNTLLITTSTQAPESKTGNPMTQLVDYAKHNKSRSFYSYIKSAPMQLNPFTKKAIQLANPALGKLRMLDDLMEQATLAKHMKGRENAYRAFILNQPVDATHEDQWLDPQLIVDASKHVQMKDYHGRQACLGVDASSTRDLTAVAVLILPNESDKKHTLFVKSFAPLATVKAIKNQNYTVWQKQGLLEIADTRAIDLQVIYQHILDLHNQFNVIGVGYDPWNLARIKEDCKRLGLAQRQVDNFHMVRQGYYTMSPLIKHAEHLVFNNDMRFAHNPCLVWQFHNAIITRDPAANRKITREKCVDKVDAILAWLCALQVAIKQPEKPKPDYTNMFFTVGVKQ